MEKKINLENLLIDVFPERESGYAYEDLNNVTKAYIKKSMLEFGNQLLQLASENSKIKLSQWDNDSDEVDKFSIINTIKQVE